MDKLDDYLSRNLDWELVIDIRNELDGELNWELNGELEFELKN